MRNLLFIILLWVPLLGFAIPHTAPEQAPLGDVLGVYALRDCLSNPAWVIIIYVNGMRIYYGGELEDTTVLNAPYVTNIPTPLTACI